MEMERANIAGDKYFIGVTDDVKLTQEKHFRGRYFQTAKYGAKGIIAAFVFTGMGEAYIKALELRRAFAHLRSTEE